MNTNLEMNTDELQALVDKITDKINSLEEDYNGINKQMQTIDGSTETWQGKSQENTYEYYKVIKNDFPGVIKQLQNYRDFLKQTIENFKARDKDISKSADNSSENLNVN